MATYERRTAGYTPSNHSVNITKYQIDSAATSPKVAINSEKIDGEFNHVYQSLNELSTSTGPSPTSQSGKFIKSDGTSASYQAITSSDVSGLGALATLATVDTAQVASGAITEAKVASGAITKAKIEDLSNLTVLGNVSGGATAPSEVPILDEDDMTSDSNVSIATQQSIKAYVDAAISTIGTGVVTITANLNAVGSTGTTISSNRASFTRNGTGSYTITLTDTQANTNYQFMLTVGSEGHACVGWYLDSKTTSAITFRTKNQAGTFVDTTDINFVLLG